jgi:hypothetical protein
MIDRLKVMDKFNIGIDKFTSGLNIIGDIMSFSLLN